MSGAENLSLVERWRSIDPGRRRIIMYAVIGGLLVGASFIFKREKIVAKKTEKPDMSVVTAPRKDESVNAIRAQLDVEKSRRDKSESELATLKGEVKSLREGSHDMANKTTQDLQRQIAQLQEEMKVARTATLMGPGDDKLAIPDLPPPMDPPKKMAPPPGPEIHISGGLETAPAEDASSPSASVNASGNKLTLPTINKPATNTPGATASAPSGGSGRPAPVLGDEQTGAVRAAELSRQGSMTFIPANTMMRGVLLNGMFAPTSGMAAKQLAPTVMRIKGQAILPNRVTHDLRECLVSLGGFGVMSSERVKLRSDLMTCVRTNGDVIEIKVEGYVVDTDGVEGIRGHLVTKQGSVLARGLLAGFASGFGAMMSPTMGSSLSVNNSSQSYLSPDIGAAAQAGALRGFSEATKDYSKFLLETAKEMYPVVELPPGVEATLILRRGFSLAASVKGGAAWDSTKSWFGR